MTHYPASDEDKIVREHLPIVQQAVAQLAARVPRHASRDDLMSAGMMGLVQAARTFDASRGVPFRHYAAMRVRGALLDELRTQDWATRPVRANARRLDTARERLTAGLGRTPTPAELAAEMGVETTAVDAIAADVHRALVVNYEAIFDNGDAGDVLLPAGGDPELELLDRERNAYLVDAIRALPERLRAVVVGYFFEDRSMQEIGDELGVSQSRVSQLRADALDLLRGGLDANLDGAPATPVSSRGRRDRRKAAYHAAIAASSTPRERLDSRPRRAAGVSVTACS